MKITNEWLRGKMACRDGKEWFAAQTETDGAKVITKLMIANRFDWANWLIVRIMTQEQKLRYAIFAAEQVINIYEKKYPQNDKPRKAIEAAKAVLKNDTPETRAAAADAAAAAYAAADAAAAAADAAYAAAVYAAADAAAADADAAAAAADADAAAADADADAAAAAATSAAAAADAAYAAAAADAAYAAAAAAAADARKEMRIRIINYGLTLLECESEVEG
mgnify:CR=1 FL=1